ncbi:hypothetical protein MTO96_022966 [Rhipicephalus appendiculatus]|uniref:Serine/threonine-protein kinase 19 n=1 Tax=Rhipicephalus appendiculatus TaxID=34631 RepID=A0A131YRK2_RHIAP
MNQKRLMRARKRLCCPAEPYSSTTISNCQDAALLLRLHLDLRSQRVAGETKSALQMLRSIFPSDKFLAGFPAVAMRHQLYAMVQNRVDVDKALTEMMDRREVRVFQLGPNETDAAVLFTEDYFIYVRQRSGHNPAVEKFLEKVVMQSQNVSYSHTCLATEYSLCDSEISELEHLGLLVPRGIGSDGYHWWLGVPGTACFLWTLVRGRAALLQTLRRSKHQELSRAELESRRLPRGTKLGIGYFVYDAIGANLVTCVKTTSGDVLRLRE